MLLLIQKSYRSRTAVCHLPSGLHMFVSKEAGIRPFFVLDSRLLLSFQFPDDILKITLVLIAMKLFIDNYEFKF